MKTIKYIGVFLILIMYACNNDDDANDLLVIDDNSNSLMITYEKERIEITFLEIGETESPTVNWSEEKGSFSATSLTTVGGDDLVGKAVFIDEETGVLTWDRSLPLGESEIFVTASNSSETATTTLAIKNTFVKGFFVGGFNNDTSDDPDISTIINDTFLELLEDRTAIFSSEDPTFSGTGTWVAEGSVILIEYTTTDNPGENFVMQGSMVGRTNVLPIVLFEGRWGKDLNADNNIEDVMGLFLFEID
ncbi:hypothetical protein [Aquimarina sediminis]|uniref:hypothetical protein n=1 Tax=Aquimarina sediminis TaxID=2070536 RepID=UPI000CA04AFC|nr:hypothetical protein [Aquimarina sediminis]